MRTVCNTSKYLNYLKYSQNNEGDGVPLDHDRRKEGADRREEQAQSKDLQESTHKNIIRVSFSENQSKPKQGYYNSYMYSVRLKRVPQVW